MSELAALLPAYQATLVARGHRPNGIKRYLDNLRAFVRFLEPDTTVAVITTTAIRRYQEDMAQRCALATVGNALTVIRSFCRWCIREGLRSDDPTLAIEWPRLSKPAPRALRHRELRKLLEVIEEPERLTDTQRWRWHRNRLTILLMLYAGLRISEVSNLRWCDVDLDAAYLMVVDGKGGKDRTVPLHPMLVHELRKSDQERGGAVAGKRDGSPLKVKCTAHIFERWLFKLGVEISAHQLRHTFASELLRYGANLRYIQELLGHERLETTQRYLLVDSEQLRGTVNLLPNSW